MALDGYEPRGGRRSGLGESSNRLPARFEIVDVDRADDAYGGYSGLDDGQSGLLHYWRILQRRKGVVVLGLALGLLLGAALTLPQTSVYQASATLEIHSLNGNFMNIGAVQQTADNSGWDGMIDLQTQIEILKSQTLVDRVKGKMDQVPSGSEAAELVETNRLATWRRALNLQEVGPEDARERARSMPANTLNVRGSGQTRIVVISADSTDPRVAADFVNLLVQEYIDQNIEARWESTQQTSDWLARRLDEMRVKLERSENNLQSYAQKTGLLFTDQNTNVDEAKLEQLQAQLTAVQGERVAKQSRWEMATNASPETLPDVLNDSTLRGYQQSLADLRQKKQELLETYTPESQPVKRVDAQIGSLQASLDVERQQIVQRIQNEYDEALTKERLLQSSYDEQTHLVTGRNEQSIQYGILRREAETNRQLHAAMLESVQEAELANALQANNIRVVDPAREPQSPYKPNVTRNSLAGLFLGGLLAIAFVLVRETADRTLKEPGDLQYYVGLPELGVVPASKLDDDAAKVSFPRKVARLASNEPVSIADKGGVEKFELVTLQRKLSAAAESFRATLTSIQFSGNGHGAPSVIVVTSPHPGEGKTTVVSNLAISMAETGQRVLLIDGDTRRPRIHDIFDVDNEEGLTALLMERGREPEELVTWVLDALVRTTALENLDILTAGRQVAGPVNLLQAKHLSATFALLRRTYDTILIDSPPMMHIPDARLFGKLADGVVLVLRSGSSTRDSALGAKLRLYEDGVHVIGAVMNDWNPKKGTSGRYGYYKSYSKYDREYHRNG